MAERVVIGYKRLFELRLLHHYWLDDGANIFDAITDPAKKEARLLTYDMRPFLSITPTVGTAEQFRGLRCVFKNTALGAVVAAPADISVPDDAIFDFLVTVKNDQFFNYTALTLRKQNIFELYHQAENKIYRYKENVPLFSNETGTSRGTSIDPTLFLSREYEPIAVANTVESLILSGTALQQLTSDQPTVSPNQVLGTALALPVFVHQNDAPLIVAPAGLTGAPLRGIELTEGLPDDLFALIRIKTLLPSNAFSLLKQNTPPTLPPLLRAPVFELRFKNRSTTWRYFNKSTGNYEDDPSTGQPFPLSAYGNAGSYQPAPNNTIKRKKASPSSLAIDKDSSGTVKKIYSDIIE